MISLFGRYASSVVQKAHARVTRENARYVREAIERDAEVERLTQQLDRANAYVTELEEALRDADLHSSAVIAEKDELIARMDAELAEVSGRLQDAQERLALVDREEDMRDEVRAKRLSDGMGDDQ